MSFSAKFLLPPVNVFSLSQQLDLLLIEMILGVKVLLLEDLNKGFGCLDFG